MQQIRIISIADTYKLRDVAATLQNAQDFLSAYRVLNAHNHASVTTKQEPILTAGIVNLAFAIELLLKALLCCVGKKARGHKMNELELQNVGCQDTIRISAFRDVLVRFALGVGRWFSKCLK